MKLSLKITFFFIFLVIRDCVTSYCGKQDMSCSHQLWNKSSGVSKQGCFVKYFKANSPECRSLQFEKSPNFDINFGSVILKSYGTEQFTQTLFEVYFSNITWHHAKMKIHKDGMEVQKNMCRTYEIWKNVTVPFDSKLMNNCTFSHSDYEGEDFVFEYELDNPIVYKKFVFKVPFYKNFGPVTPLNFHQVFSYVDVTNPELLTLHVQPISWKYNVSRYLVELFLEDNNVSTLIANISLHSQSDSSEELQCGHPILEKSAEYYFSVAAISSKCDDGVCLRTVTPKIFVRHLKNTWALASSAGVLFIVIIWSVFISGFIYFKKRKKKERNFEKIEYSIEEKEPEKDDQLKAQFETDLNTVLSGTSYNASESIPLHSFENSNNIQNFRL